MKTEYNFIQSVLQEVIKMERRNYRSRAYRHPRRVKKESGSYFFIKANICLGIIICAFAAVSTENETIRAGCDKAAEILSANTDFKTESSKLLSVINGGGDLYTFAGEKEDIKLSDEIKSEIESRSSVYEKNNKGAPQTAGLFR